MRVIDRFLNHFNGNQAEAGRAIGKSQQLVWHWYHKMDDMPINYVPKAARILGVKPKDLRPDFFED